MFYDCDICGHDDPIELDIARKYIREDDRIHVCKHCGFVYVRERRRSREVAEAWKDIFGAGYTSEWPGTKARLFYAAEWYFQKQSWLGKRVLDIGCGYRHFMGFVRDHGGVPWGIEPAGFLGKINISDRQCVETVPIEANPFPDKKFDVITILWTLENTTDCNAMIEYAKSHLAPKGHIVVATGSRIRVPFKKPLGSYFSDNPADTHCFRFSMRSLLNLGAKRGLKPVEFNDFAQRDELIVIFAEGHAPFSPESWQSVVHFFDDWGKAWP